MKRVAVIMGSDSDLPVMCPAVRQKLDELGINYEMRVMSAHRTPADVAEFAQNAYKRDFGVIIAAAGEGGASCGLYCRKHNFAVIGIPIKASTFDGLDALLATVQMPSKACPWQRLPSTVRQRRDTCGSNAFACGTRTSRKSLTQ